MTVALSGYYGFSNTGDEAIGLAVTTELKRRGLQPIVLSADPTTTGRAWGVRACGRMNLPAVTRALLQARVLVSGGGGLLQDLTSRRTLQYYLAVIWLARRLGRRVVVLDQSVGPLSAWGEAAVRRALRGVSVSVRDRDSLAYLERLGLKGVLGGDPALLLEPPAVTRDPSLVVIAPRGGQPDVTSRLEAVARELVRAGRRVTALSFQPGVDTREAERLAALPGVTFAEAASPGGALAVIAASGFVLGVRLHACILAAACGVPFAGVAYDPKVRGFCADAGAPSLPLAFTTDDALAALGGAPDWTAVAEMRERARASFDLVEQAARG